MRRAFSLLELVVLGALGSGLLVVVLSLSGKNLSDQQDLTERGIAQTLCFDLLERFAHIELQRPLPGQPARPPDFPVAGPHADLFGPIELDLTRTTLFDHALLTYVKELHMDFAPRFTREPDPKIPGLFLLTVRVGWTDRTGRHREVHQARWCFAP